MIFVSVVIPCYRQARFLAEAIESVLAQTYQNFEVIVVNDGSPDDTEMVVASYRDHAGVRYVWQANAGVSAARNAALRESRGLLLSSWTLTIVSCLGRWKLVLRPSPAIPIVHLCGASAVDGCRRNVHTSETQAANHERSLLGLVAK